LVFGSVHLAQPSTQPTFWTFIRIQLNNKKSPLQPKNSKGRNLSLICWVWPPSVGEVRLNSSSLHRSCRPWHPIPLGSLLGGHGDAWLWLWYQMFASTWPSPALSLRSRRLCAHSPTIRREPTPSQKPGLKEGRNLSLLCWVWPSSVGEVGPNSSSLHRSCRPWHYLEGHVVLAAIGSSTSTPPLLVG
jgi:hypothetical protein